MAFERLNEDISYISKLDDEPNDVGELTAAELKAEFDRAANVIKNWLNTVLLTALEDSAAAGSIGINSVSGLTGAENVQAALEKIELQMVEMTQGSVADSSIDTAKLMDAAVTTAKLAALAVTAEALATGSVITSKIGSNAVTTGKLAPLAVTAEKLADMAVTTAKLAAKSVTTAKIADRAVGTEQIDDLAVTTSKLFGACVTADKLRDEAVITGKIATAAVTLAKLAEDVKAAFAPAYTYGTADLTAGTSPLETGTLYFVYE